MIDGLHQLLSFHPLAESFSLYCAMLLTLLIDILYPTELFWN